MIRRIAIALSPVLAVVVASTVGYCVLWGWSWLDALYMTVITVGTVGFREVRPLTAGAQLFTIGVILAGVATGGFALAQIFDLLLEVQLQGIWEVRRMNKRIAELSGHTIVAGLGRVGSVVVRELEMSGSPFVIVDLDEESATAAREAGWAFVHGDATEEQVLIDAGIERARAFITALDSDAQNLFATVTARAMNPEVFIVARCAHETTEQKMRKAGANRVLTPNVIGGRRMATMVLHPTVSDYLDLVAHGSGLEFQLQEVRLRLGAHLDGVTIAEARIRETTGCYILAVRRKDGEIDANPSAETVLRAGDRLVVLGTAKQVADLLAEA